MARAANRLRLDANQEGCSGAARGGGPAGAGGGGGGGGGPSAQKGRGGPGVASTCQRVQAAPEGHPQAERLPHALHDVHADKGGVRVQRWGSTAVRTAQLRLDVHIFSHKRLLWCICWMWWLLGMLIMECSESHFQMANGEMPAYSSR